MRGVSPSQASPSQSQASSSKHKQNHCPPQDNTKQAKPAKPPSPTTNQEQLAQASQAPLPPQASQTSPHQPTIITSPKPPQRATGEGEQRRRGRRRSVDSVSDGFEPSMTTMTMPGQQGWQELEGTNPHKWRTSSPHDHHHRDNYPCHPQTQPNKILVRPGTISSGMKDTQVPRKPQGAMALTTRSKARWTSYSTHGTSRRSGK